MWGCKRGYGKGQIIQIQVFFQTLNVLPNQKSPFLPYFLMAPSLFIGEFCLWCVCGSLSQLYFIWKNMFIILFLHQHIKIVNHVEQMENIKIWMSQRRCILKLILKNWHSQIIITPLLWFKAFFILWITSIAQKTIAKRKKQSNNLQTNTKSTKTWWTFSNDNTWKREMIFSHGV